ncbi:MAG: hypothetical protein PUB69_07030 [Desulfovibrionaceae bacterium]|nr:hypothetical protein [Desulfovibrionaceae bacterium]
MQGNGVSERVETLLREQLEELGEHPDKLDPGVIRQNMHCDVYPDRSMIYFWKGQPLLRVIPEETETGTKWRMFTRDNEQESPSNSAC